MIQLISQLKGYFYINPILSLSFAITIFSFVGIPPLLGFFAKQMVLSAALDNGYIFLSLIAILTSVIGAVYYLSIVKEIFFFSSDYNLNPLLTSQDCLNSARGRIYGRTSSKFTLQSSSNKNVALIESVGFNTNNMVMTSPVAITISVISLIILLFLFMNKEWLSMGTISFLFILCVKEFFSHNILLLLNTNTILSNISYLTKNLNFVCKIKDYQKLGIILLEINSFRSKISKLILYLFQKVLNKYKDKIILDLNSIKNSAVKIIFYKFSILKLDARNLGLFLASKNFTFDLHKNIFVYNNISPLDMSLYLSCWSTIFILTASCIGGILWLIGVFFSFLSSFLFLLDFSVRFIKGYSSLSEPASKVYLIEVLLLILLFMLGAGLSLVLLAVIESIVIKIRFFITKFLCFLEQYILKMDGKPSHSRVTRSKSKSKIGGSEPNPKDDLVVGDRQKSKKRKKSEKDSSQSHSKKSKSSLFPIRDKNSTKYKENPDYVYTNGQWRRIIGSTFDVNSTKYNDNPNYRWNGNTWLKLKGGIHDLTDNQYKLDPNYQWIEGKWRKINNNTVYDPEGSNYLNNPDYIWNNNRWRKIKDSIFDANNAKYADNPDYWWSNWQWTLHEKIVNKDSITTLLPEKSHIDYPEVIRNILSANKGCKLNKFMSFGNKNQDYPIADVLFQLYKKDSTLFNSKGAGAGRTTITDEFINNVIKEITNNKK